MIDRNRIIVSIDDDICIKFHNPLIKLGGDACKAVPLQFVSQLAQGYSFAGQSGSLASGITSTITRHKGDVLSFDLSVSCSSVRENVQIIQPIELPISYKSYVIVPGVMYNGNRFIISPQPYCPHILTEGVSPDGPIVVADVPRLSADTYYRTELAANALAIPGVGIFDAKQGVGIIVGVQIYGQWGVTGINIQTLPNNPAIVEITLPVMRARRYRFCDWIDTDETGMTISPSSPVTCRFDIIPVKANSIARFVSELAKYGYSNRGTSIRSLPMSFSESAELIETKLDRYNWSEKWQLYTESMKFVDKIDFKQYHYAQTGWTCGGVTFYAMTCSENQQRRQRARKMIDTICANALTPSGYFHGLFTGKRWQSFGIKRPGCRAGSLIRRPLGCARDILKAVDVMKARNESVNSLWLDSAKAALDAAVRTSRQFGHLGYTVDFDTGDVLWGDSCCGAFGIEALVRGYKRFSNREYLETAQMLAEYYVERFIENGYTCGGVGDALMACDSESNYALLAGLVALFEITDKAEHLEWAELSADLFSTWVVMYDPELPSDSPLGRLGIQGRGAVIANIQNQHGAPGICTASGKALLKLSEFTGNERYLILLRDIARCIPQMIVRTGQEDVWGDLPIGSISERLMTMDGMERCGYTAAFSAWPEISLLHVVRELPQELIL